ADAHPGQDEPYGSGDVCRPPRQCPVSIPDGSATGQRLVQYFDKGRMELNQGAQGTIVTAGLLVHELITGQQQLGDAQFQALAPAAVPVAGDSTNVFPLYRDLAGGAAVSTMTPVGTPATLLLTPQGSGTISQPQDEQTVVSLTDAQTGHGLPKGFADFRSRVGLQNVGLALTDPFWADVQVAGITRRVLIQAFERRVLTYNPANPAQFQVEFGNVGQQYYQWRYGTPSTAAPPATDPVSPPIAPQPPGGARLVTRADNGQTIALFRGMTLVLALGNDLDWQVQIADEAIVSRDRTATPPADSQGVYVATQGGQTTLTATGNPRCYTAMPRCLAPSRSFRVQIVVKQLPLPVPTAPGVEHAPESGALATRHRLQSPYKTRACIQDDEVCSGGERWRTATGSVRIVAGCYHHQRDGHRHAMRGESHRPARAALRGGLGSGDRARSGAERGDAGDLSRGERGRDALERLSPGRWSAG
ncbi:MAG: hypothetical protein M3008_13230, partial [Chloroflexota bacterium]|nr:hypothetical protein [Chloroflexota bacterium]